MSVLEEWKQEMERTWTEGKAFRLILADLGEAKETGDYARIAQIGKELNGHGPGWFREKARPLLALGVAKCACCGFEPLKHSSQRGGMTVGPECAKEGHEFPCKGRTR